MVDVVNLFLSIFSGISQMFSGMSVGGYSFGAMIFGGFVLGLVIVTVLSVLKRR